MMPTLCFICRTPNDAAICPTCTQEADAFRLDQLAEAARHARQLAALADGRHAEAEGRPVIYIHGRPYALPDDDGQDMPDDRA